MSMYNLLFGNNPFAPVVLALLSPREFGRVRDAWVEKLPDGSLRLVVYTRNGGNNRGDYMPDFGGDPLFIEDRDDSYDSTYASIYFRVPENIEALLCELGAPPDFRLGAIACDPIDTGKRWADALRLL